MIKRVKGRPRKKKIIHSRPSIDCFGPKGPIGTIEEIPVSVEEYEAIRLHDLLGKPQKQAAMSMGISQQSFSQMVRRARRKVADAIVNAKAIRIEGGDFINKRTMDVAKKLHRK
ncbi:MAG: DUF134 domain-containing protein [Candidatus Omnitrophota bacterium]